MPNPLATIEEGNGYVLNIFQSHDDIFNVTSYHAERTAPDGTVTTPQLNMTAEECIRYLSHVANGLAYQASKSG